MRCGGRGGSDRRKGAGSVGGRSLDGGYQGGGGRGLVILKATRKASCKGESFGSKNASHPHTSLCCDTSMSNYIKEQASLQPGFNFEGQSLYGPVCHDEL